MGPGHGAFCCTASKAGATSELSTTRSSTLPPSSGRRTTGSPTARPRTSSTSARTPSCSTSCPIWRRNSNRTTPPSTFSSSCPRGFTRPASASSSRPRAPAASPTLCTSSASAAPRCLRSSGQRRLPPPSPQSSSWGGTSPSSSALPLASTISASKARLPARWPSPSRTRNGAPSARTPAARASATHTTTSRHRPQSTSTRHAGRSS